MILIINQRGITANNGVPMHNTKVSAGCMKSTLQHISVRTNKCRGDNKIKDRIGVCTNNGRQYDSGDARYI